MGRNLYAQDGVNVAEGDNFSAFAGAICRDSFKNSPFVEVTDFSQGHFRGPRGFQFVNLPDGWFVDAVGDGIGTKVALIDAVFAHRKSAQDIIAMTAGDITRWGGKPLVFVNVLDVATLGEKDSETNRALRMMLKGLGEVAREQKIVCFRGETAELGACVGSPHARATAPFNWAGCMLGVYLGDRMITGATLAPGQTVVALQEPGFRSNGFSSVRKALEMAFGENYWSHPDAKRFISAAARPSKLYDAFLARANGWTVPVATPRFTFHLITHITGGGIVGKFAEDILFPRGLSARLENLFSPTEIVRWVAKTRGMSDEECYRTFNCGNGALVVLDEKEVAPFVRMAREYDISAQPCGVITATQSGLPTLEIFSGFSEKMLTFFPEH